MLKPAGWFLFGIVSCVGIYLAHQADVKRCEDRGGKYHSFTCNARAEGSKP